MAFTPALRELATTWVDGSAQASELQRLLVELERCAGDPLPSLPSTGVLGERYPVDEEGYALALDPLEDGQRYREFFARYGFVVGKSVIAPKLAVRAQLRLREIGLLLSDQRFDLLDPATAAAVPVDADGAALLSRGFYEIYHDAVWAEIRQSLRLYLHHVLIWGTPYLWTSYDRFGVKPPEHPESKALPLHVDQSPLIHPDFQTIQGILALGDCPEELGVTVLVPGSRTHFSELACFAEPGEQYVELSADQPLLQQLQAARQPIPLRSGDIVTWDSRCAHAASANLTADQTRFVALVATGRARQERAELVELRRRWFVCGLGKNERDAYLHASIRPRYQDAEALAHVRQPEQLDALGERLYGFTSWRR